MYCASWEYRSHNNAHSATVLPGESSFSSGLGKFAGTYRVQRKPTCIYTTWWVLLSRIMKNLPSGFPTRSDTDRAVGPQKMARSLKFRKQEGLDYLCNEIKGADQLHGYLHS